MKLNVASFARISIVIVKQDFWCTTFHAWIEQCLEIRNLWILWMKGGLIRGLWKVSLQFACVDRLIKEYTKFHRWSTMTRVFLVGEALMELSKKKRPQADPISISSWLWSAISAHLDAAAASSSKVSNLFLALLNDGVVKSKLKLQARQRNDNQVDLLTFQDFGLWGFAKAWVAK